MTKPIKLRDMDWEVHQVISWKVDQDVRGEANRKVYWEVWRGVSRSVGQEVYRLLDEQLNTE